MIGKRDGASTPAKSWGNGSPGRGQSNHQVVQIAGLYPGRLEERGDVLEAYPVHPTDPVRDEFAPVDQPVDGVAADNAAPTASSRT